MAKISGFSCDGPGCSHTRTPHNHWLLIQSDESRFTAIPWNDEYADKESRWLHVCGEACAVKLLSAHVFYPPQAIEAVEERHMEY